MSAKQSDTKSTKHHDQSQWIFAIPETCLADEEENKPTIVKLQHPKSGHVSLFLFTHDDHHIYEITQFKEEFRSWFIGETVQQDGSLYFVTPVDPVFLILPYLIKESKSGKFMPLDQIVSDENFPECHRLCSCSGNAHLSAVAQVRGDDDFKAYRYDKEKTLEWLKVKVERLSEAIQARSMDITGGAQASIFKQSNKSDASKEATIRYAFGMVSDYIAVDLAKELKQHMNITDPVIEHEKPLIELPNAKKPKTGNVAPTDDYSKGQQSAKAADTKMTSAQKKLSQVDKSGMKTMMSFFTKKSK